MAVQSFINLTRELKNPTLIELIKVFGGMLNIFICTIYKCYVITGPYFLNSGASWVYIYTPPPLIINIKI